MDVDVTITNWTTSSFPLGCYCAPETLYTSPFYNLSAGNTYNFGTLAFFNIQAGLTPDEEISSTNLYFHRQLLPQWVNAYVSLRQRQHRTPGQCL